MLRAIATAKKKNDRIDAGKIADCLRCDFLLECHVMPTEIRDRRRTLRYWHLLVRQMVQMENRVSGLQGRRCTAWKNRSGSLLNGGRMIMERAFHPSTGPRAPFGPKVLPLSFFSPPRQALLASLPAPRPGLVEISA
jgi:hypothetical protein